jgi:hypothetical protein
MFSFVSVCVVRRGLCDRPIPRPEDSYRLWCVAECDQVKINYLDTYREYVEEGRTTKQIICSRSCSRLHKLKIS